MLIVAPEGSAALDSLRSAIENNDTKAMHAAAKTLDAGRGELKLVPVGDAAQELIKADTYGELYYGSSLLAAGVLVAGVNSSAMIVPYAGGELHDSSFEFVQYQRAASSAKLSALVVTSAPSLTAAEAAAMSEAAPEARLGAAGVTVTPMCTPAALVACLTPGVMVAIVGTLLAGMKRDTANVSPAKRAGLDPSATARELIELRRRALTG